MLFFLTIIMRPSSIITRIDTQQESVTPAENIQRFLDYRCVMPKLNIVLNYVKLELKTKYRRGSKYVFTRWLIAWFDKVDLIANCFKIIHFFNVRLALFSGIQSVMDNPESDMGQIVVCWFDFNFSPQILLWYCPCLTLPNIAFHTLL